MTQIIEIFESTVRSEFNKLLLLQFSILTLTYNFMEVLSYQVFFIIFIALSSLFGRTARNWVVFISSIFTIFAVYTSGLMIIQFISIIIGFLISESILSKIGENRESAEGCAGVGCLVILIGVPIGLLFHSFFYESNDSKSTLKIKIENQKINEKENSNSRTQNNKIEIIKKFITAENNRDITEVNYYISNNPIKFWSTENPTKNEINNIYYKNWSKYEYTKTQILEIRKIENNYYSVKVNFTYNSKSHINIVLIKFDEYNKIIEIS
jgi:hypothetical protein